MGRRSQDRYMVQIPPAEGNTAPDKAVSVYTKKAGWTKKRL